MSLWLIRCPHGLSLYSVCNNVDDEAEYIEPVLDADCQSPLADGECVKVELDCVVSEPKWNRPEPAQ